MGVPKALLPLRGASFLAAHARAGCGLVVVRPDDARVRAEIASLGMVEVLQPEPERGPFSSICLGLAHADAEVVCLLPVDVPMFQPPWARLTEAALLHGASVAACEGAPGHPVALRRDFAKQLESSHHQRLDHALARVRPTLVETGDPRCVLNLNDVDAYRAFLTIEGDEASWPAFLALRDAIGRPPDHA